MTDGVVTIPLPGNAIACDARPDGEPRRPSALGQFLAGPENRLVEPAVHGVLDRRTASFSPLVFYGPSGTGKSHLARGLAAAWKARFPGQRVAYAVAVDFARELDDAIEAQAVEDLRTRYRGAALAVFEDIGGLVGKDAAQEELLYTLDALLQSGAQVVVTARTAPSTISGLLPGIQSRLAGGLTIPLSPPGLAVRLAIVQCLAQLREMDLAEPVVRILAEGLSGTVPELLGALVQLEVPARHERQTVDARAVRQYLAERNQVQRLQIREIAVATARHFSLKLADLRGSSRQRPVVTARDVAMYLSRTTTNESLHQIGQFFGGRDHTTALHACRKTKELLKDDPAVRQALRELQEKFQGG